VKQCSCRRILQLPNLSVMSRRDVRAEHHQAVICTQVLDTLQEPAKLVVLQSRLELIRQLDAMAYTAQVCSPASPALLLPDLDPPADCSHLLCCQDLIFFNACNAYDRASTSGWTTSC
jgi:hypothetical protein